MQIKLNGLTEELEVDEVTLTELMILKNLDHEGKGIAVAVNWSVVPRAQWNDFIIKPLDEVEIITARQGG